MGLDMYLYLRKYNSVLGETAPKDFYPKELYTLMVNQQKRNFLSKYQMYQIGYWRKANAIHKYFVDKCANGVDECQEIYVSASELLELGELCNKVLKDHSLAQKLLPTCDGFFFGTTDYDEWYFNDIQYTAELINNVLPLMNEHGYDVIYKASW